MKHFDIIQYVYSSVKHSEDFTEVMGGGERELSDIFQRNEHFSMTQEHLTNQAKKAINIFKR